MDYRSSPILRIKVITLGNSEVGKSCIIKRFCEKRFVSKYLPTVGVDYGSTRISVNNKEVQMNIFDLAGNSIFYEVRNEFYNNIHGVMLIYDVSEKKSFESLNSWLTELLQAVDCEKEKIACVVCGNKCDKKREINQHDGRLWPEYHRFPYFETSALTGDGITEMFEFFVSSILQQLEGKIPKMQECHLGYNKEQLEAVHRLQWSKNSYEKLGLQHRASRDEINRAYRRIAVLLHPDKNTVPGSEEAFKTLVTTRTMLLQHDKQ